MIEIVRVIKYRYETPERMATDMRRWTHTVKVKGMSIESQHFMPTIVTDEHDVQGEAADNG